MTAIAIGVASRPIIVNIQNLFDDAKSFQTNRDMRWPGGVASHFCGPAAVVKNGRDDTQPDSRRYECKGSSKRFDDLSGTVFAGHHLPLRVWVPHGAEPLGSAKRPRVYIDKSDARDMITTLR